ncbi:hypothetical protein FOA52_013236 [Chlamydomonas sp. UWO 241]|nr:hypothetical protein FOA52_013236 [Chlamydomonas sp. UWO 241]
MRWECVEAVIDSDTTTSSRNVYHRPHLPLVVRIQLGPISEDVRAESDTVLLKPAPSRARDRGRHHVIKEEYVHQHCVVFPEGVTSMDDLHMSHIRACNGDAKPGELAEIDQPLYAVLGESGAWCYNAVATPWLGKKVHNIIADLNQMEKDGVTTKLIIYLADNAKLQCGTNPDDGQPDIVAADAEPAAKNLRSCVYVVSSQQG